jgi:hypothetical protein
MQGYTIIDAPRFVKNDGESPPGRSFLQPAAVRYTMGRKVISEAIEHGRER